MLLVEQFIKHAKNFDGKKHAKPIVEIIYHMMYTKVKIFYNTFAQRNSRFCEKYSIYLVLMNPNNSCEN